MLVDSESTEQPVSNYNTLKQTDIEITGTYIIDVKLRNKHANIPISYLNNQVGVVYNCWIFSEFMIGDHMLHEPFCNQKKKEDCGQLMKRSMLMVSQTSTLMFNQGYG